MTVKPRRVNTLTIRIPPDMLKRIDTWQDEQDIFSRNAAMLALLESSLDAEDAKAARRARRTAA